MKYSIWLQDVLSFGFGRTRAILNAFGSAYAVYCADNKQLADSGLFSNDALKRANNKSLSKAEKVLEYCIKNEIGILTCVDERYPVLLQNIPDLPVVLYYKGQLPIFDDIPSVCIVGPRKCSEYGIKAAYSLSSRLSKGGMAVVSGGAVGVDAAAHEGALAEKGVTIAVMPCGFGYDYLKANENLRENIIQNNGCIITEFPPKYPVKQGAFQIRNRLMSALSLGTVIIEAGERSGALITARHALEQGKDIFVIPGKPNLPQYIGSNKLLRDGAKPLLEARDVFYEYQAQFPDKIDIDKAYETPIKPYNTKTENKAVKNVSHKTEQVDTLPKKQDSKDITASNIAKAVYAAMPDNAFCVDELSVFNDYNAAELMSALTELELCGYIKAVPGGRYLRIS